MHWTMSSTTFLQETQELTLFYNKVWKFIISKNGTIIPLREKTTLAGITVEVEGSSVGCEGLRGIGK